MRSGKVGAAMSGAGCVSYRTDGFQIPERVFLDGSILASGTRVSDPFGRFTMVKRGIVILIAATLAGSALADPLDDATAAYRQGDYATTLELLMPLADGGNRAAQHNLGAFFAEGQGDYAEAERWFRMAADQGLAESQYNMGVLYQEGRGVPQDYHQSAIWYRNAADHGRAHAPAQPRRHVCRRRGRRPLRRGVQVVESCGGKPAAVRVP